MPVSTPRRIVTALLLVSSSLLIVPAKQTLAANWTAWKAVGDVQDRSVILRKTLML